jgi:hypothetical protein
MVRYGYLYTFLLVLLVTLSSCEAIGDIFQAGMAVGIVIVIAVVLLLIWLVSKFRR